MSARGRRDTRGQRAARQHAAWRAEGQPTRVTREQAEALTGIAIPYEAINLSTLAVMFTL